MVHDNQGEGEMGKERDGGSVEGEWRGAWKGDEAKWWVRWWGDVIMTCELFGFELSNGSVCMSWIKGV